MLKLIGIPVTAFIVCALIGPVLIPYLHKLKFGQSIRECRPASHMAKSGTPTMGGLMMLAALLVALLWGNFTPHVIIALVLTVGHAVIGFIDDYIKVVKKRNLGLTASQKLILQFLVAAAFLAVLAIAGYGTTTTTIPFVGKVDLGFFYYIIAAVAIVGIVNSVNLTDGIDGLDGSVTFFACVAFMLIACVKSYLGITAMSAASAGACLGFLVWNFHPAKVFMGDTGSLFLGGLVCALAFAIDMPILLIPIGIIYIVEELSVILQVSYFKITHGKRLFKMSPIHHHFEMCGWSEVKIVGVFSAVTAVFGAIAFALAYFGA